MTSCVLRGLLTALQSTVTPWSKLSHSTYQLVQRLHCWLYSVVLNLRGLSHSNTSLPPNKLLDDALYISASPLDTTLLALALDLQAKTLTCTSF